MQVRVVDVYVVNPKKTIMCKYLKDYPCGKNQHKMHTFYIKFLI